jgi:ABC-type antimicrobial peptide transport system permease subunit
MVTNGITRPDAATLRLTSPFESLRAKLRAKVRQDFAENIKLAFDTLRAHKLRSFLTVLGVVIGVAVIIVVASLLVGFDSAVQEDISQFGADTAFVSKFQSGIRMGRLTKEERMRKPLTAEDGFAIEEQCPAVKAVAISLWPEEDANRLRYKDQEIVGLDFRGTFPGFVNVYANAAMKSGRFLNEADVHHKTDVVVVGESIAETLFPISDPLDKEVLVNGHAYRIIGVLEKPKGGFNDSDEDKRVIIPYDTMRKVYPSSKEHGIRVQAHEGQLDAAVDQVRELLRRRRNVPYSAPDNFGISTAEQIIEQFHSILAVTFIATTVLSSIGLLVGGVGVMNIMLVSVTERTREIGVRKAIGARRRDITTQFLFEAMALTTVGGILGILFGGGVAQVVRAVSSMKTAVPLWAVAAGIIVAASVGLIFGVWPAMKAARLDPVEALRYE